MKMKSKIAAAVLAAVLALAACSGNTPQSAPGQEAASNAPQSAPQESKAPEVKELSWEEKYGAYVNVDYEAIIATLPELTEEEKNYTVELGFRDCDHMVPGPIGEAAGIFENLGMKVNVTKTGKVYEAMAAGQMDLAYMGFGAGQVRSINNGAPYCVLSGNHTGGSWYLVVRNEIETIDDLLGTKLAIGSGAETSTSWREVAAAIGAPYEIENYEVFDMSDSDEYFAFKAGQLDGFTCCDPWGSYAEFEGIGKIMGTAWGTATAETSGSTAGLHCVLGANRDFIANYPNLAIRMVYAHALSIQYMYQHPYRAAEIFAEYFDVPVEVGLRTIWIKGIAEGRTINWELENSHFETWLAQYERWGIPAEDSPEITIENIDKVWDRTVMDNVYDLGIPQFSDFIDDKVDKVLPIGMTFDEFMVVAKEIDGIE